MNVDNLKVFSSVLKQNKDLNLSCSIVRDWQENEWLLKDVCKTLDDKDVFVLVEFGMGFRPYGHFSIAVTEEELCKFFYESRRIRM